MASNIKTRFLIISDTHGKGLPAESFPAQRADVAIHCGDLTDGSYLEEFQTTLKLLRNINAPLKLVIAGSHDFTLDIPVFKSGIARSGAGFGPLGPDVVAATFGTYRQVRQLFDDARDAGIVFLDEGTHRFTLDNGAQLTVYASPHTPSKSDWGFSYHPDNGHDFEIEQGVDVVMTHGPPQGILDRADRDGTKERVGCTELFAAVARARPRLHYLGHIHEQWGAKLVTWRKNQPGDVAPSHFTVIDNGGSVVIDKMPEESEARKDMLGRYARYRPTSRCADDENSVRFGAQTLFVNAAIQGTADFPFQPPWLVDIELPSAG